MHVMEQNVKFLRRFLENHQGYSDVNVPNVECCIRATRRISMGKSQNHFDKALHLKENKKAPTKIERLQ